MKQLCDTCMHRIMNDCPYESDCENTSNYPEDPIMENNNMRFPETPCTMCSGMMDSEMVDQRMMIPNMKTVDLSEDFETDEIDAHSDNTRAPIDEYEIFHRIERHNPEIIRNLIRMGIPYNAAVNTVKRIIYLTLYYSKRR